MISEILNECKDRRVLGITSRQFRCKIKKRVLKWFLSRTIRVTPYLDAVVVNLLCTDGHCHLLFPAFTAFPHSPLL